MLLKCLSKLFSSILNLERIPSGFKQSITVTLHKGHGKSQTNPNNYRAISLLPVISKLFEKVILTRIEKCGLLKSLNPLQHGFQRNKSCKMTSLIYQESVNYCLERGTNLYTCFLDASKAFDMTWIDGLLYKLYGIGFTGKLLRIIKDLLTGASSRIVCGSFLSDPFSISQGTRQGSICSSTFYTICINDLLNTLNLHMDYTLTKPNSVSRLKPMTSFSYPYQKTV